MRKNFYKKILSTTLISTLFINYLPNLQLLKAASINTAIPTITHNENKSTYARLQWDVPISNESIFFVNTCDNSRK